MNIKNITAQFKPTHTSRALRACLSSLQAKTTVGRPVGPVSHPPTVQKPTILGLTRGMESILRTRGLSCGTVYIHTTVHSQLFLHPTMSTQSNVSYSILCTSLYSRVLRTGTALTIGNALATKG